MSEEGQVKDVFDQPVIKDSNRLKAKRVKEEKTRLHIYITEKAIARIDEKAEELGLTRSGCLQMLIHFGLNNMKTKDFIS